MDEIDYVTEFAMAFLDADKGMLMTKRSREKGGDLNVTNHLFELPSDDRALLTPAEPDMVAVDDEVERSVVILPHLPGGFGKNELPAWQILADLPSRVEADALLSRHPYGQLDFVATSH